MKIGCLSAISLAVLFSGCSSTQTNKQNAFIGTNDSSINNGIVSELPHGNERLLQRSSDKKTKDDVSFFRLDQEQAFKFYEDSNNKYPCGRRRVHANFPLSSPLIHTGSLDVLNSLYENPQQLVFSQLGIRRSTDKRNIVNIGIGQRRFYNDWILGYNAFYDIQISDRHHKRLGIGGEYWRDSLHLSINGYYALNGCRRSLYDKHDEDHAVHGYDIRAQGWFPNFPQVNGKIKFEQYFGKNITLLHTKQHDKDPCAITLGIDYSPVPLFTVGIDNTFNGFKHDNTKLSLSMNYQLGVPLSHQIDSIKYLSVKSQEKSKLVNDPYCLIERDNDIMLNRLHQEEARTSLLRIPSEVKGRSGETKMIHCTFQGKRNLRYIRWDDRALKIRGGKIVPLSSDVYAVHLPDYQDKKNNHFSVSAVAYDVRGNASNRSNMNIIVQKSFMSSLSSSIITSELSDDSSSRRPKTQWDVSKQHTYSRSECAKLAALIPSSESIKSLSDRASRLSLLRDQQNTSVNQPFSSFQSLKKDSSSPTYNVSTHRESISSAASGILAKHTTSNIKRIASRLFDKGGEIEEGLRVSPLSLEASSSGCGEEDWPLPALPTKLSSDQYDCLFFKDIKTLPMIKPIIPVKLTPLLPPPPPPPKKQTILLKTISPSSYSTHFSPQFSRKNISPHTVVNPIELKKIVDRMKVSRERRFFDNDEFFHTQRHGNGSNRNSNQGGGAARNIGEILLRQFNGNNSALVNMSEVHVMRSDSESEISDSEW